MRPYDEPIVSFRVLLRGYTDAVDRFGAAASQADPVPGILALFEALNWAVALDDFCAKHWAPDGVSRHGSNGVKLATPSMKWLERWCGDQTIGRAIRFVRNRVHHQWAEALEISSEDLSPVEWSWRATDGLPLGRADQDGMNAYDSLLAGRPAASALASIRDIYSEFADLLEPNLATLAVIDAGP